MLITVLPKSNLDLDFIHQSLDFSYSARSGLLGSYKLGAKIALKICNRVHKSACDKNSIYSIP